MFEMLSLSPDDTKLLDEIKKDRARMKLTESVLCRPAVPEDLPIIMEIVAQARKYLRRHGVDQWQGEYPNEASFTSDMERGECHVVTYGGDVAGFFTLTLTPENGYEHLTDGRWRTDGPYCTIHRSAVAARFRGTGMSRELMRAALDLARTLGVEAVRADTHRKNKAMRALLAGFGFTYRGNVLVDEPNHDPRRQAFDLPLSDGR